MRVYDGIAYLAGYAGPPTLFGILIADVRDPNKMEPLSFIPCNVGTRCPYLRVIPERKLLARKPLLAAAEHGGQPGLRLENRGSRLAPPARRQQLAGICPQSVRDLLA